LITRLFVNNFGNQIRELHVINSEALAFGTLALYVIKQTFYAMLHYTVELMLQCISSVSCFKKLSVGEAGVIFLSVGSKAVFLKLGVTTVCTEGCLALWNY
jgi:hypothetical protein